MSNRNTEIGNELNDADLNYIKEKTNLSLCAIFDYYKKFLLRFNNGRVNREQFNEIIDKLLINDKSQKGYHSEQLSLSERFFEMCDKDDDGYIDFKEYLVLFWSKINGNETEKLSFIFEIYDLDKSGHIDFYELHSIVKVLYKLKIENSKNPDVESEKLLAYNFESSVRLSSTLPESYHIAMGIMKKFDTDKNAKLSKQEFIDGCMNHKKIQEFLKPLKIL